MSDALKEWARWFAFGLAAGGFVAVATIALLGIDAGTGGAQVLGTIGAITWVLLEADRRDKFADAGDADA